MDQIIIKQSYFDKIKTAVDSINQFFESGFATKNFPADTTGTDWAVANVVDMIEDLDPVYVSNQSKLEEVADDIADKIEAKGNVTADEILNDRVIGNAISSVISFTSLQKIADNFDAFSKFINGIYTFELFLKPSQYRNEIDIFSQDLELPYSLDDLNVEVSVFSIDNYVSNLMNNPDIRFPDTMNIENEISRIQQYRDAQNTEVVVDNTGAEQVAPVTESAKIEVLAVPDHIKYDKSSDKLIASRQLLNWTDKFIKDIRKCKSPSDLKTVIESINVDDGVISDMMFPYIIVQAMSKSQKSAMTISSEISVFNKKKKEASVSRFADYSIYDTFQTDRDSTIEYVENYMKLNLVNDKGCAIGNNVLLALFNIFDSRYYLSSLYNIIAERKATKKTKNHDSDMESFVKDVRGRINNNSRQSNVYKPSMKQMTGDSGATTDEVQESVNIRLEAFGDMSPSDMCICEAYKTILYDEIKMVGDRMYNRRVSPNFIDSYLGDVYTEAATGEVPDYMKSRIELSDGDKKDAPVTEVPDPVVPPPANSINDLADSIDQKMNMDGPIEDALGKDANVKGQGIVYNITYNNSFNKNDLSTTNDLSHNHGDSYDLSSNKDSSRNTDSHNTTANSHNTSSHHSQDSHNTSHISNVHDSHNISDSYNSYEKPKNNNNNSDGSLDSKESRNVHPSQYRKLSNGMTIEEMFTFLEAEEPLSNEVDTTPERQPPKEDSLTRAMDRDRKSLPKLQQAKKSTQKAINTVRATFKPVERTKKWLTKLVNSLVERDENKVKEEIIMNPSYRTSLYKGCRLAIKLGLLGIAFTVSGWLGAACVAAGAARLADKNRLRKEVQSEMISELKVMDEKIEHARHEGNQQELYKLIRLRGKMEGIAADAYRGMRGGYGGSATSSGGKNSRYW